MPTGYTMDIEKGISFKEFVMSCAKAFGACITMRDEPSDMPIPKKFTVSDYHKKKTKQAEGQLKNLQKLTVAASGKRSKQEYQRKIEANKKYVQEKRALREKYMDMLTQVRNWTPPSSKHMGLKRFMIKQITSSVEFDCNTEFMDTPELLTGSEWLEKKKKKLLKDSAYHKKEDASEKTRVAGRNEWVMQLRKSLK